MNGAVNRSTKPTSPSVRRSQRRIEGCCWLYWLRNGEKYEDLKGELKVTAYAWVPCGVYCPCEDLKGELKAKTLLTISIACPLLEDLKGELKDWGWKVDGGSITLNLKRISKENWRHHRICSYTYNLPLSEDLKGELKVVNLEPVRPFKAAVGGSQRRIEGQYWRQ